MRAAYVRNSVYLSSVVQQNWKSCLKMNENLNGSGKLWWDHVLNQVHRGPGALGLKWIIWWIIWCTLVLYNAYLHQFNIKLNWVLMTFWAPQLVAEREQKQMTAVLQVCYSGGLDLAVAHRVWELLSGSPTRGDTSVKGRMCKRFPGGQNCRVERE